MVMQTRPSVIRAHEGCRVSHVVGSDALGLSQLQNAGSEERRNEQKALDDILPKGGDAEDREAVIDNADQQNADHCAEDMEPARPQRRCADENRSGGVQEVEIADILWSARAQGQ
jgi:hypothetical protein